MTNINNLKPIIENKKPVETVYEIKNEIPSFEEFMKNYENDGNLNYADLSSGSVGEAKGYGPMPYGSHHSCGGISNGIANDSMFWFMYTMESIEKKKELKEKISELKSSLSRVESELKEIKFQYRRGEISNYRLREIIKEKEVKIRELESENRKVSKESEERWRKIGKLEMMIEELKELL